jgi:thioredoxin-dependent peroxiredoxin
MMLQRGLVQAGLALFMFTGIAVQAAPKLGQPAPSFNLPSSEGKNLKLKDFAGKWLVLYFYPADFTGGCTIQARRFQQDLPQIQQFNAQVVGVSQDTLDSHKGFCDSEGLKFPLLSDASGEVGEIYGAPGGARNTYLIDPKGVLRQTFIAVNPSRNSTEVLEALKQLQVKTK